MSSTSGNGLLPIQHQAIIGTNVDLLPIEPLGTNLSEIWIAIQQFSLKKCILKCLQNDSHFVFPSSAELSHTYFHLTQEHRNTAATEINSLQ